MEKGMNENKKEHLHGDKERKKERKKESRNRVRERR